MGLLPGVVSFILPTSDPQLATKKCARPVHGLHSPERPRFLLLLSKSHTFRHIAKHFGRHQTQPEPGSQLTLSQHTAQIFNLAFFFSSEIQEEYKRRNDGQENLVRANDVFFAVHALMLSSFTLAQTYIYKVKERRE